MHEILQFCSTIKIDVIFRQDSLNFKNCRDVIENSRKDSCTGELTPEDRPFVVSTLRVKRKKEKKKKMERKEGVWSKRRVSFRTSLMRNNNVAYTSTPSGCRLPSSRLCSSGVFFEHSSFYPRPSTHYFASATDHEKNCARIARIRVSLEN